MVYEVRLKLGTEEEGVLWPRRPQVGASGLLGCMRNLPLRAYKYSEAMPQPTNDSISPTKGSVYGHGYGNARFRCVSFSVGGDFFAAVDEKGRVFAFFPQRNRYSLVCHLGTPALECAFSPQQRSELLVTCEDFTVRCVDVQSKALVSSLRGHRQIPTCVSFQRPGQLALTASRDAVILWDSADWSRFRTLNAGPGVEAAKFVGNGELVAVCFRDDSILMWELNTLALQYRFGLPTYEHPPGLKRFCVSDHCRVIVASGLSPFIYVWEFESQTLIRIIELPATVTRIVQHSFVPCTSNIISVLGDDGQLNFLNVTTKQPKVSLQIANKVKAITHFDIDAHTGKYLAAATSDGCLLLYDLDIARETAYKIQSTRHGLENEGFGANKTTTANSNIHGNSPRLLLTSTQPLSSHLIDQLFGTQHHTASSSSSSSSSSSPSKEKKAVPCATSKTGSGNRCRTQTLFISPPPFAPAAVALRPVATTTKAKMKTKIVSSSLPSSSSSSSRIIAMTKVDAEVQRRRLAQLLRSYERYPDKYRMLAWRVLLQLPENRDAFATLLARDVHPAYVHELQRKYPIQNHRLFRRLQRVLSAIGHWSPAFGEVETLPAFVFPFVKVCENDDLMAFEVVLSILVHWGADFLVRYPFPPLHLLELLEKALEAQDAALHAHFVAHDIHAQEYGWSLVSSAFSEVLSRDDWLCLWDHLITAVDTPSRLWSAVLAFLEQARTALLRLTTRAALQAYFHTQHVNLNIHVLVVTMEKIPFDIPAKARLSNPPGSDEPMFPLRRGDYPAFRDYPHFVVDYDIQERNRISREENELEQKRALLAKVEAQTAALEASHRRWMEEKAQWLEGEHARRIKTMNMEKQRILDMQRIHTKTRERRLKQIEIMEKNASDALRQTSQLLQAEHERYAAEWTLQKEKQAHLMDAYKEEEELRTLEAASQNRVKKLMDERGREERLQEWRSNFFAQCRQQEIADLAVFDAWKAEDERNMRAKELQQAEEVERRQVEQEQQLFNEWQTRIKEHQMEKQRQMQILATERQRRMHTREIDREPMKTEMGLDEQQEQCAPNEKQNMVHDAQGASSVTPRTTTKTQHVVGNPYIAMSSPTPSPPSSPSPSPSSSPSSPPSSSPPSSPPSSSPPSSSFVVSTASFTNAQHRRGQVDEVSVVAVAGSNNNGNRDENDTDVAKASRRTSFRENQNLHSTTWKKKEATSSSGDHHHHHQLSKCSSEFSSPSSEKRLQQALDEISSSSSSSSDCRSHVKPKHDDHRDLNALERELRMAFSDDDDDDDDDIVSLEQRPLSELDLDHVMFDVDEELFSDSSRSSSSTSHRRDNATRASTTKEERPQRNSSSLKQQQQQHHDDQKKQARTTSLAPAQALSTLHQAPQHSHRPASASFLQSRRRRPPPPPLSLSASSEPEIVVVATKASPGVSGRRPEHDLRMLTPPGTDSSSKINLSRIIVPETDAEMSKALKLPPAEDEPLSSSLPPPLVNMVDRMHHPHDDSGSGGGGAAADDDGAKGRVASITNMTSDTTKKLLHLQEKLSSMQLFPEDNAKKLRRRQEDEADEKYKGAGRGEKEMTSSRGGSNDEKGRLQIPPTMRDEEHERLMARAKELLEQHKASQKRQEQLA